MDNKDKKEDEKIFEKENRIYKYYINQQEENMGAKDFIETLLNVSLLDMDKSSNMDLVRLYRDVGFDNFFVLIEEFSGKTVKFPKADKIKKLLLVSLATYYVNVLGMDPKEAGKVLGEQLGSSSLKQKSIKSIVKAFNQELSSLFKTYIDVANGEVEDE